MPRSLFKNLRIQGEKQALRKIFLRYIVHHSEFIGTSGTFPVLDVEQASYLRKVWNQISVSAATETSYGGMHTNHKYSVNLPLVD